MHLIKISELHLKIKNNKFLSFTKNASGHVISDDILIKKMRKLNI
jgi:hypothetical protein